MITSFLLLLLATVFGASQKIEIDVEGGSVNLNTGLVQSASRRPCDTNICAEADMYVSRCRPGDYRGCSKGLRDHLDQCYPDYRWFATVNQIYAPGTTACTCDVCCSSLNVQRGLKYDVAGQRSDCTDPLIDIPAWGCYGEDVCPTMRRQGACLCKKIRKPVWAYWSTNTDSCVSSLDCPRDYIYAFK